ncbi:hypothetical protein ACOY7H_23805 [Enterobacter roggenkampii]|uniref:hypothetical protein n=3 Tax=Enterobacter TaxID=547 RepID=UPI000BA8AAE2|nr:hypothetical protein [Enterobacter roggenkampii]EKY3999719.1 hypothetical protein [Enterobacter roggenkampii]PAO12050.1 hypothetical protein CIW60_07280 [Enterobacter roggenkampii]WFC79633.1 hypothetical protein OM095_07055 [Enterobacter roggenkampii]
MSNLNKKVIIGLAVFFMLALVGNFFYSIYAKMIDKSSYTDWISAFCNVVMAGATVAAVLTARNYLAQFTAQEGYKLAIHLVNNDFPQLGDNLKAILNGFEQIKKVLDESKVIGSINPDTAPQLTSLLCNPTEKLTKLSDTIIRSISSIETYGLKMNKERDDSHLIISQYILSNHLSFFEYSEDLRACFDNIINGDFSWEENNKLVVNTRDYYELIDKTQQDYVDVVEKTNSKIKEAKNAIAAFDKMVAKPRHITNIFKV